MTGRLVNLTCLIALSVLSGCATYTYQIGAFRADLARNNYDGALKSLEGANSSSNRLLFLLENGLVAHYRGHYHRSNTYFEAAERLADQLFTRSLSREAAALVTNDTVRPYRGEDFERVFIHYYRALNYWYLGLPEDALVECRKANLKLAYHASQADFEATYRNDAFIHYMTGLFYGATGELNDAYVSYRNAEKAYQTYAETFGLQPPASLQDDLFQMGEALDTRHGVKIRLASAGALRPPDGDGELILFSEIGFIPGKTQKEIDLALTDDDIRRCKEGGISAVSERIAYRYRSPSRSGKVKYWLRVALPAYPHAPPRTRHVRLTASGKTAHTVPAEDLSAIARTTFQDKQPVILARTAARGLAKYLAYEGAKKKNRVLGFLTNLFNISTEVADTRGWVSLPHTIQIGRLRLPPGLHDLTVQSLDSSGQVIEQKTFPGVKIHPGARTFLNTRTYN